jgi:hypothetical protein
LTLDEVIGQIQAPAALSAAKNSDTRRTRGWSGLEVGLDGIKEIRTFCP